MTIQAEVSASSSSPSPCWCHCRCHRHRRCPLTVIVTVTFVVAVVVAVIIAVAVASELGWYFDLYDFSVVNKVQYQDRGGYGRKEDTYVCTVRTANFNLDRYFNRYGNCEE